MWVIVPLTYQHHQHKCWSSCHSPISITNINVDRRASCLPSYSVDHIWAKQRKTATQNHQPWHQLQRAGFGDDGVQQRWPSRHNAPFLGWRTCMFLRFHQLLRYLCAASIFCVHLGTQYGSQTSHWRRPGSEVPSVCYTHAHFCVSISCWVTATLPLPSVYTKRNNVSQTSHWGPQYVLYIYAKRSRMHVKYPVVHVRVWRIMGKTKITQCALESAWERSIVLQKNDQYQQ